METKKQFPQVNNIIVAYGSAKFAPGGKNELSVPTSRAYKECATRFNTVVTSEFRSSKVSYENDSGLQLINSKSLKKNHSFRGILWDVQQKRVVSRDLNAALNIQRMLLKCPDILRRDKAKEKL